MGLTPIPPVADRWVKGNRLAVVAHLPIGWAERGDDFAPAAAAAVMDGRSERHRDVQDPIRELFRYGPDELMAD